MGSSSSKAAPVVRPGIGVIGGVADISGHVTSPRPHRGAPDQQIDLHTLSFHALIEFPTPHLLRVANQKFTQMKTSRPYTDEGELLPYPVPSGKSDIFNVKSFEAVDKYALDISANQYQRSLGDFTDYLTKQHRKNSLAMARVIFRWLSAQDITKFRDISPSSDNIAGSLRKIKDHDGYFCDIFVKMCRHVGFQCHIVRGYARHAHLEPGEAPKESDSHRWVAIVINNEWRLVDPHWGSSQMVGGGPGDWVLIDDDGSGAKDVARKPEGTAYSYDETYFLTNPEQYIYSHFPVEDASWQLLARTVTLREFTEMAYLKPAFFDLDLRLIDHRRCVLYATEGEIDITIGTPPGKARGFMYRLWMSNKQSIDDVTLDRFCVLQQKNDVLSCRIYFPVAGKFKLELFAQNQTGDTGNNFYQMACAYIIHADRACEGIKALPKNSRTEWGPGHDLLKAGLHPITHHDALIEAEDTVTEVRFKYDKPVEIMHNLRSNTKTSEELRDNVIHYMDTEKGEVVLSMKLPDVGDYALEMFAKEEGKKGSVSNVCNYIVSTASSPSNPSVFPEVFNGRLGALYNKNAPKLKLTSHRSPIITCPDSGELYLEFSSSVLCQTMNHLENHVQGRAKEMKEGYVWTTHHENNKIKFNINFPEPGMYGLVIFAKDARNDNQSYTSVYQCSINVPLPKPGCAQFPKTYAGWKPGFELLEPMASTLPAHSSVQFSANVPHATDLAVIKDDTKWTHLKKDSNGIWKGQVKTGYPGVLQLAGKLADGSSYSFFMEYQVDEDIHLKEQEIQQNKIQEVAKKENESKRLQQEEGQQKRMESFVKAKHELLNAITARDLEALRKAVKTVEHQKYTSRLSDEIETARNLIKSLERVRKLNKAILNMDQMTMLEIKKYANPPKLVHEVILATLLLLGNNEALTKEWPDCQKHLTTIGKNGLHRRIKTFDVTLLHPEIASRALEQVGKYRLDDVTDVSAGAGTFYAWTVGMIEEVNISNHGVRAPPADSKRQEEIFHGEEKKKTRRG